MALSKETQEWLNELKTNGSMSDEVFNQLKASVEANSKADDFVKGSVLRQSDYSRQSADIQKAKKEVEDSQRALTEKETQLTGFRGELETWRSQAQGSFADALKAKEEADARAHAALARLSTVATKYGIPEDDIKLNLELPVKKEGEVVEGKKYITIDDLQERLGQGTREAGLLDAMLHDLDVQHQELFGKRLPNATLLVQESLKTGIPLTKLYEDKFKVADRVKQVQEEQYQARLKNDVETELAKRLSSAALPGGGSANLRTDLNGSPVLGKDLKAPTSEEGGGISAAIAAFNAGKYSQRH